VRGVSAPLAAVSTATIGRYRLREVIGRGGSSVVYRAINDHAEALPRVVAVKVALDERAADPDFRRQFHEQRRVSAAVDHPSVLPVVDSGTDRGRPYLVMPHIDGGDLAHQLTGQALTVGRVLVLLRQVADGLDAMHRAGVLHLDVKPANVLVGRAVVRTPGDQTPGDQAGHCEPPAEAERGRDARAFLADLGLCRFLADAPRRHSPDFVGSPRYSSPEHLQGRAVRASADVYSLACVLFASLAGRPPYVGEVPAVVTGHLSGRVPSLAGLTGLPRCLDRVIRRAMHPDPGSRYASCADLVTGARLAILDGA
jgi:serine/threonine protein kinase